MYEIQPDLTKDFVLSHLSQEQLMEHYLGIKITFSHLVLSPLRPDRTPTCGFKYARGSNILYFKDFSGHFWGDCFDLVQFKYSCSFFESLQIIASDFNLMDVKNKVAKVVYNYEDLPERFSSTTVIGIKRQAFTTNDIEFWKQFGLNSKIMERYGVYSCDAVFLNGRIIYRYNKFNPAYAYRFMEGVYKIYFPKKTETRFLCNTNIIQGYAQLPEKGDLVILSKSLKDVMVLYLLGYAACAPQSETQLPAEDFIADLQSRFKKVLCFYDYDRAGRQMAQEIQDVYNIESIFLTNGDHGTINYGAKDISDFIRDFDKDQARDVMIELLEEKQDKPEKEEYYDIEGAPF